MSTYFSTRQFHFWINGTLKLLIMSTMRQVFGILLITLISFNCSPTQNDKSVKNDTDKSPIKFLTEFYNSYNSIWVDASKDSYQKEIEAMVEKYCTEKLYKEFMKYWEYGHDLITDDYGACKESLSSLKIVKNPTKENYYSISYNVLLYPVPSRPELTEISFNVILLKENDNYKIDEIISNIEH